MMDILSSVLMFTRLNELTLAQLLVALLAYLVHSYRSQVEDFLFSRLKRKVAASKSFVEYSFVYNPPTPDGSGSGGPVGCNTDTAQGLLWFLSSDKRAVAQTVCIFMLVSPQGGMYIRAVDDEYAKQNELSGHSKFYKTNPVPGDGNVISVDDVTFTISIQPVTTTENHTVNLGSIGRDKEMSSVTVQNTHLVYKMTISSVKMIAPELLQWIDDNTRRFKRWLQGVLDDDRFVYHMFPNAMNGKPWPDMSKMAFASTKTFDTMFFEGKVELMQRLNAYQNNIELYKRLGVPHTLGILLYGEPGCGKTSVIKAIANHLNRSMFVINLKLVPHVHYLRQLLTDPSSLYSGCNSKKLIYVFEEVDCNMDDLESNPFLSREYVAANKKPPKIVVTKPSKDGETSIEEIDLSVKKPMNLTTGELLELMDGVGETGDRVIVFTTNHVELLDNAFLRPGRIDMCMHFKKLRKVDLDDMFKQWFGRRLNKNVYNKINDYTLSQAEMGKLCFKHKNNPDGLENELLHM